MIETVAGNYAPVFNGKYTVEAGDLTGGADTLDITLSTVSLFTDFVGMVLVEDSTGVIKTTNITKSFANGVLSITDATTEFAADDVITVLGVLH